jgi:hypothetical protein
MRFVKAFQRFAHAYLAVQLYDDFDREDNAKKSRRIL